MTRKRGGTHDNESAQGLLGDIGIEARGRHNAVRRMERRRSPILIPTFIFNRHTGKPSF